MLDGLRVVEASWTVAGAAAGAMFRAVGASVVKVETPIVPGWGRRHRTVGTHERRLLEVLDRGKTRDVRDLEAVVCEGDVTVVDATGLRLGEGDPHRYADWVRQVNAGTWVTISPFGLDGDRVAFHGSELTTISAGGVAWYMRSSAGRPMKPAGFVGSIGTGHFAVLAALHGILSRTWGHGPIHLDLSSQDSAVLTGVFMQCARSLLDGVQRQTGIPGTSELMHIVPRRLVRCADRYMVVIVLEDHQWPGLVKVLGNPDWAVGVHGTAQRAGVGDLVHQALEAWAADRSATDCAAILQAAGVPAAPVNSCQNLLDDPGLAARGFFQEIPGEQVERVPGPPGVSTPVHPGVPRSGFDPKAASPRRPRVLDLSHVLAGPLATSWLGAMGLDVLRIEDPKRTDVYRRIGPFVRGQPNPEASVRFAAANHSKRSFRVELDTTSGRDRLSELISSADVVIENLSSKRARALGLTTEQFSADHPGVALLSSSGFGRLSTMSDYRAYGFNIHAFGGIVNLSRDKAGQPRNLGTSWADPLASVWVAVVAAAQALKLPQQRDHFDLSMVEAVAYQIPEYFSLLSRDGLEVTADESRLDGHAPHGIYACQGVERWLSIAISEDAEWQRLQDVLGRPSTLDDPRYATLEGRLAAQDDLDLALAEVLATRERDELFVTLQEADIAASPVWSAEELVADRRLWERGLFQTIDHPVTGPGGLTGLPWRIVDEGAVRLIRTPLLGEHTSDSPDSWWLSRGPARG